MSKDDEARAATAAAPTMQPFAGLEKKEASLEEEIEALNDQIQRMRQLLKPPRSCATKVLHFTRKLTWILDRKSVV